MTQLSDFLISKRWPAQHPQHIQLYSFPTPNGVKVSIALEELGLPYEAHTVAIGKNDQFDPGFLEISPNNKIPAIIDPDGPGGEPISLFESGAIMLYLADKTGKLMPSDARGRWRVTQWLMFQMGSVGPMFGQLGYFYKFAGSEIEDERPVERYLKETTRLLGVLEKQLQGKDWIDGDYSIADIAIAPWLRTMRDLYGAGDEVGLDDHKNVVAFLARFLDRPAVQRGLVQPPRE